MSTQIRRAAAADALQAAQVFTASFKSLGFVPKLHSDEENKAFVRGFVESKETWVAIRNGRVVGLACFHNGWLEHLYVHPERHNTRTGTALLERVKEEHSGGFQFWVFQANLGARRFYERHGCALVRVTDGQGNDEKLPDALYVWPAQPVSGA